MKRYGHEKQLTLLRELIDGTSSKWELQSAGTSSKWELLAGTSSKWELQARSTPGQHATLLLK